MTAHETAVTGLGLVTAAGVGVKATWSRLCQGHPTATRDPALHGLPVDFNCRVPETELANALGRGLRWRTDRFIQLALVAAREAVRDARLEPAQWSGERVGVIVGVGGSSYDTMPQVCAHLARATPEIISPTAVPRGIPNMAAGEIAVDLGARGPGMSVSTACASGATALGIAHHLLSAGMCDIALAGGSDSGCHPLTAAGFWRLGALSTRRHDPAGASRPFDTDRDGFVLAEGAAIMVLERAEHARARRVHPYGMLAGFSATTDAHHHTRPHPQGDGALRALRGALSDAGLPPTDIDHINAHASSTPLNDRVEAAALCEVFPEPPPVTATKSVLGHSLGAAGAIEAIISLMSLRHQTIHPTANLDTIEDGIALDIVTKAPRPQRMRAVLSASFGFGGHNAVLVLTAP
ncbi:beta-ketoacyl-[acyl-carrier-protein] synthase family protein [Streptomyces sp. ET3-23]|uniref:beta-ketoacyl-[acyl-carrier-protein] synthase family protein n=1 Tax=Streptomyces sp. ET3-23 TaxID=2885643 RepID=UPI001D12C7D4|nr:beta-ketoacyl-[acyl-carrier-protein] synthase family protein [Streptomyces sp. ET3-23]MCC2280896.1 beta-ketoacyl-[acyl-carrier-protein] synthase family protein [Streptomyces sp. ET3-23]